METPQEKLVRNSCQIALDSVANSRKSVNAVCNFLVSSGEDISLIVKISAYLDILKKAEQDLQSLEVSNGWL
jgi:hypothetical protein